LNSKSDKGVLCTTPAVSDFTGSSLPGLSVLTKSGVTLARVYATFEANAEMRKVAGLRDCVEKHVLGVIEAALDIRKLPAGTMSDDQAPLLARVGDYEVAYSIDLQNECATVLSAIPSQSVQTADRFEARAEWPPPPDVRRLG
jgi:hypothetical protein